MMNSLFDYYYNDDKLTTPIAINSWSTSITTRNDFVKINVPGIANTNSLYSLKKINNQHVDLNEILNSRDSNIKKWHDLTVCVKDNKAHILNNETTQVNIRGENVCIRGLGDYFTNMFQYTGFPEDCKNSMKLTVPHAPAGAFHQDMEGLVLAAHTHCGQIRLPFIGALWIPSDAPLEATCGLYADKKRTVFTTAGAGTTLLPIRIGTTSSWDLLTIRFSPTQ